MPPTLPAFINKDKRSATVKMLQGDQPVMRKNIMEPQEEHPKLTRDELLRKLWDIPTLDKLFMELNYMGSWNIVKNVMGIRNTMLQDIVDRQQKLTGKDGRRPTKPPRNTNPEQLEEALEGLNTTQRETLKAHYQLGLTVEDSAARSGVDVQKTLEVYNAASDSFYWAEGDLFRLAKNQLLGYHIMELVARQIEESNLTPTESQELQHFVQESNMLRRKVLSKVDKCLEEKFDDLLSTVENARDFKSLTDSLKSLNEVSTSPLQAAKALQNAQTTQQAPSVHITLSSNNPKPDNVVIDHRE